MHFILSWDIKAVGRRREVIEGNMARAIKNFSWVRPVTTFYIVKVNSQSDWFNIRNYLATVAGAFSSEVTFVMSPLMQGGRYDGFLPPQTWSQINERVI